MDLQRITGLTSEQPTGLTARVHHRLGPLAQPGGRPAALGRYRSIALVAALHRHNLTQDPAGAVFDVSPATVSRRWDLLRPLIAAELSPLIPDPAEITGTSTGPQRHGAIPAVRPGRGLPQVRRGPAPSAGRPSAAPCPPPEATTASPTTAAFSYTPPATWDPTPAPHAGSLTFLYPWGV